MPKVTEGHRASRRDQILDAALRCFAEQGFQRTSMSDIIAASGLSSGAIYLYFDGKREIAIAAAQRVLVDSAGKVAFGPVVPPPSQMISALEARFAQRGVSFGFLLHLWGEAAIDPGFCEVALAGFSQLSAVFDDYLTRWATQEQKPDPEAWAAEMLPVVLGIGQGYIVQCALQSDFDREGYLQGVAHLLA